MVGRGQGSSKYYSIVCLRSSLHGGCVFQCLPSFGGSDCQLAFVCAVVALHRWTGIFLDPAPVMAEAEIPDDLDDGSLHRLSGVSIRAERQYKTKSSLRIWHSPPFDRPD